MWYKTYASWKYAKISFSIHVGNIIFEHLFTYDLCINTEFWKGNPISYPLEYTYIFIYFCLIHMAWAPKIEPQRLYLISPWFLSLFFIH